MMVLAIPAGGDILMMAPFGWNRLIIVMYGANVSNTSTGEIVANGSDAGYCVSTDDYLCQLVATKSMIQMLIIIII